MKQFVLTLRPRHLRHVFFVDKNYSHQKLLKLIYTNQRHWGGRYDPIVLVNDNIISPQYITLLKFYDPDYVFFSDGIDTEVIKKLRLFNPVGYFNLDAQPPEEDVMGVDAFYFISQFDRNAKVVLPGGNLWQTTSPLLDFYKVNFGLESSPIMSDSEIAKQNPQIVIDKSSLETLNKVIHIERPINQASLARRGPNTRILRNLEHARYNDCELIVSRDKNSTVDLIYFWNRLLYEGRSLIYATLEEIDALSQDKYFGGVMRDLSSESIIDVVSFSLTSEELEQTINNKLAPIAFERQFRIKNVSEFPFEVLDGNGLYERDFGEAPVTQTLVTEKGLINIPKLSFTNKVGFYPQKWAIDIQIKKAGTRNLDEVLFPFTTQPEWIVKGVKGRINKLNTISIFIHNQINTSDYLEIAVPSIGELMSQLVCHPFIDGVTQKTKYSHIGPHDASNRLTAFLKAFAFDFATIDDVFTDIFWVTLFEELITNDRVAGDSIHFAEIRDKAIEAIKKKGLVFGEKGKTYVNIENLELGLKRTIGELCNQMVFLKGFNLKCPKCSSEFWYHVSEINDRVKCKGCMEQFQLPVEPPFAYRLNYLIKNNIYQSKINRDGNLTVIRSLVSLNKRSHRSFEYSPQINVYDSFHATKACTDIDIVCISDGRLVIGEAKHSADAFSESGNKPLKALAEVVRAIRPDTVVLACYEDPNGKLKKAKQGLIHILNKWQYQPEIDVLLLHAPDDFHIGHSRYFLH